MKSHLWYKEGKMVTVFQAFYTASHRKRREHVWFLMLIMTCERDSAREIERIDGVRKTELALISCPCHR